MLITWEDLGLPDSFDFSEKYSILSTCIAGAFFGILFDAIDKAVRFLAHI